MKAFSQPSGPRMAQPLHQRSRRSALNVPLACATALAGAAAWIAGSAAYPHLTGAMPRPVLMALLFTLLFALTAAAIMAVGRAMGTFEGNLVTRRCSRPGTVGVLVAGGIALALLAALFEWVYELGVEAERHDPTSYVFVVDDSASMEGNDPGQSRFAAISTVLAEADGSFPFMVYRFSNEPHVLRDMAPASEGIPSMEGAHDGGTALKAALNRVLDDHDAGRWDGGAHPKVVLLSDGVPTDLPAFDTLSAEMRRFVQAGIGVSTVGLGEADDALMQRIARATGGVYVKSPDAAGLTQAMAAAAVLGADRDLLSARCNASPDALYAAMRVVFLFLLGALLGVLCAIAYGSHDAAPLILAASAVQALLGAVGMEVGVQALALPAELLWLALWVLLALTIALVPELAARMRQRGMRAPLGGSAPFISVRR